MNQHERIHPREAQPSGTPMPVCAAAMTDRVWAALLAACGTGRDQPPTGWSELEAAAWRLYAPLLGKDGERFVFAQIGQSLDGRVATIAGDAVDVSGAEGLKHLHRCRALADCVIVGATTAIQDDPRLTVRLVPGEDPARCVIDPNGRLGSDAALYRAGGGRCVVVQANDMPRPDGIETVTIPATEGDLDPIAILDGLAACGFRRILVEGGGTTIGRFLDAGAIDRLHIGISPLIIGAGQPGLTTAPIARLVEARRPATIVYGLATDIIVDCDLR